MGHFGNTRSSNEIPSQQKLPRLRYTTLGIHPLPFFLSLGYILVFTFTAGVVLTEGAFLRYWYFVILGITILSLSPLIFLRNYFEFIDLQKEPKLLVRTWDGKSLSFSGLIQTETFWTYKLRGKSTSQLNDAPIGGYKRRGLNNDIYIWLKLTDNDGKEQYFYELIKMQSKFPNNHRYEHRNVEIKSPIQVYDVDELIDFLESVMTDK